MHTCTCGVKARHSESYSPLKEHMIIQPIPSLPWSKVEANLCEFNGNHYLVMADYYSNFIEFSPLQQATITFTVVK